MRQEVSQSPVNTVVRYGGFYVIGLVDIFYLTHYLHFHVIKRIAGSEIKTQPVGTAIH